MDKALLNSLSLSFSLSHSLWSCLQYFDPNSFLPSPAIAAASWSHRYSGLFFTFCTRTSLELMGEPFTCSSGNQVITDPREKTLLLSSRTSRKEVLDACSTLTDILCICPPSFLQTVSVQIVTSFSKSVTRKIIWSWRYHSVATEMRHPLQQRIVGVRVKMGTVIKGILMLSVPAQWDLTFFKCVFNIFEWNLLEKEWIGYFYNRLSILRSGNMTSHKEFLSGD